MPRRRGSLAAGPLAAAAMALMALPAAWTQPPRLALSSLVSFVTAPATSFGRRFGGGATPPAAELLQQLELEKSKNLELTAANARLREQLEALNAGRSTVKDPKLTFLPAGIVLSTDTSQWRRTFIIDKGTRHGLARGTGGGPICSRITHLRCGGGLRRKGSLQKSLTRRIRNRSLFPSPRRILA